MKKIIPLCLTFILIFSIMTNVYAASSFKVSMKASNSKLTKNEEFTVDVKISNIQDENGINVISADFEYDEESLTLVSVENGDATWEKPSFFESSKKFTMSRSDLGKEDETLFQMIFTVNENSVKQPKISLKNITASNGEEDIEIKDVTIKVDVEDGVDSTQSPSITPNSNKTITSTQVPKADNEETSKLPNTGLGIDTAKLLLIPMVVLGMFATFSFIQIDQINKKAKSRE